jgi:hypothetical protein
LIRREETPEGEQGPQAERNARKQTGQRVVTVDPPLRRRRRQRRGGSSRTGPGAAWRRKRRSRPGTPTLERRFRKEPPLKASERPFRASGLQRTALAKKPERRAAAAKSRSGEQRQPSGAIRCRVLSRACRRESALPSGSLGSQAAEKSKTVKRRRRKARASTTNESC